jgi:hypothetical protein
MNECHICKGPLITPSLGRIGCATCDWSEAVDPDGNLAGPDFSDGPEFAGWPDRSSQSSGKCYCRDAFGRHVPGCPKASGEAK